MGQDSKEEYNFRRRQIYGKTKTQGFPFDSAHLPVAHAIPPWILKWVRLESSGRRLISLNEDNEDEDEDNSIFILFFVKRIF